jgi:hypothetical protein
MVLLCAYRNALHTYDPEDKLPSDDTFKEYADLSSTLMFQNTNIIIYVICFPPTLLSRCMCVIVTLFTMIGTRVRMEKQFLGVPIEWDGELIFIGIMSIGYSFFQLYGLEIYVSTVLKDCQNAKQQETEFSYLANFLDNSLLVLQ